MVFSLAGVLVIYSMEPGTSVLIPDWEDSLPAEAKSTPIIASQAVRAALIEQLIQINKHTKYQRGTSMSELIDLTLTLGGDRISLVPGLVGVETEPIQTHASHARSNQKLCLATHIGTQ
ncbi:MAG: hypothetical protein CM1200mP27_07380 [Chloroflexota bacterium]|nr:MAG: hypothetical protein CM1200mP27_07380 [Chloroflexota bacterium]